MERGEMRVEANISISENDTLGTKVEVKNLNSFRAVEQAIEHEIERQHALYIREEQVVQETRGWDENRGITYSQRLKETAEDYRYFPDPDLPKLEIPLESDFSRLAETLPELPQKWREKYTYLGLPREQIEILVYNEELRTFFERVVGHEENMEMAQRAANYITSDVQALIVSDDTFTWDDTAIECFRKLMDMLMREVISSRVAKDLLKETLSGSDPELLAAERGLLKEKNTEVLEVLALGIITEHASVVAEYRSGKEGALQFLVGQGMKVTKGAADPELLRQIIQKKISDGDQ
jgi:aspartyl-tRNA(Asn)/glutamyl-tRNA(Gln) amidotransferase subunit B